METPETIGQVLTHEVELMSGFAEDVQTLLDKVVDAFGQSHSVGFEVFSSVWREMEFSLVSDFFAFVNYLKRFPLTDQCRGTFHAQGHLIILPLFQIFCGRKVFRELWEFTECGLRIVKEICIKATSTTEKIAAFYILYALYLKQPLRPRVGSLDFVN